MYTWHAAYSFPSETSRHSDIVITNNIYHCQTRLDCFVVPTGSEGGIKSQPERSAQAIAPGVGSQIVSEDKKNQRVRERSYEEADMCLHCAESLHPDAISRGAAQKQPGTHIKHTHTHILRRINLLTHLKKEKNPTLFLRSSIPG